MKRKRIIPLILVLSLFVLGMAGASGVDYVEWWVIGGGGGHVQGGGYTLDGTVGQHSLGSNNAGSYQLCAGYWCGQPSFDKAFLPSALHE